MTRLTEAARGVYVIAVTPFEESGALDLESVDRMVDFYEEAGVDGLTVLGQLGEALGDTPFVLQDYPLTTNVTIAPKVIDRIVKDVPNCVMLKHEDWPGLAKITALRASSDKGETRRISILCGNGGLFLPEEMGRGADGAMTGFCYPEMMVGVVREHTAGNVDRAAELFAAYLPLARYEQQQGIGLAARKYVLAKRGVIKSGALRKPRPVLSALDIGDVERLLAAQTKRLAEIGA